MRMIQALIFAFVLSMFPVRAMAAESCRADFDIGSMTAVETCYSGPGWASDFTHIDDEAEACFQLNLLRDVGIMSGNCASAMGGDYYSASGTCYGAGVLDGHIGHECPYLWTYRRLGDAHAMRVSKSGKTELIPRGYNEIMKPAIKRLLMRR